MYKVLGKRYGLQPIWAKPIDVNQSTLQLTFFHKVNRKKWKYELEKYLVLGKF